MKIAFVGKGGSGKSTLTASFASFLTNNTDKSVVVFDADLNIHAPELLGFEPIAYDHHLSNPNVSLDIRKWLIGKNHFDNINEFRKSTPPSRNSNILDYKSIEFSPLKAHGYHKSNLSVFAVGTYQEEEIGASCYHNNLAVLENILSHFNDKDGYVIVDTVAGVDSFAGTMHAQFDMTCFIAEPTKRSVEVYNSYTKLAKKAGVYENLYVIGNKVRSQKDIEFLDSNLDPAHHLGNFYEDEHIRDVDQEESSLKYQNLNDNNKSLLQIILNKLDKLPDNRNERLKHLHQLHKKYVAQSFIKDRFGDLTNQIDTEFRFN